MLISPYTPLSFARSTAKRLSDGIASRYVQTYSMTDHILLEFIGTADECPNVRLGCGDRVLTIGLNKWEMNEQVTLYFATLCGLSPGIYRIEVDEYVSNDFRVTDDEQELAYTSLIQYSMKDNRRNTDGVFLVDGMRKFFDFRVPGGLKDSDVTFACDEEQFAAQNGDIVTLYSRDTVRKKFTLGGALGVPVEMAEILNRAFTCNYVYIDGVRYARVEGSVPEPNMLIDGLDSFVYKLSVQKIKVHNVIEELQNQAIIRRVGDQYRGVEIEEENINLIIE